MIYTKPPAEEAIDQGDLIDDCPLPVIEDVIPGISEPPVRVGFRRVIVLTQTCDLANGKTTAATVAEVIDARQFVDGGYLRPADVKGPLRSGRIWGLYFLP